MAHNKNEKFLTVA